MLEKVCFSKLKTKFKPHGFDICNFSFLPIVKKHNFFDQKI
jgi:hypothetical protein